MRLLVGYGKGCAALKSPPPPPPQMGFAVLHPPERCGGRYSEAAKLPPWLLPWPAAPRLRPRGTGRGRGSSSCDGMIEAAEAAEAVAEAVAEGEGAAAVVERGTL